jgi:hypothetical protein
MVSYAKEQEKGRQQYCRDDGDDGEQGITSQVRKKHRLPPG